MPHGAQRTQKEGYQLEALYLCLQLIDLEEPVQDAKGFVYEKKPLVDYLRQAKGRRKSPIAETNHIVTVNELKPAKHVVAAQRRRV